MPATSPGNRGASWSDIASVISITSCATCRWLWRALWKTQPFHGSKRDLRLHGSKRDLHIKTLLRNKTYSYWERSVREAFELTSGQKVWQKRSPLRDFRRELRSLPP